MQPPFPQQDVIRSDSHDSGRLMPLRTCYRQLGEDCSRAQGEQDEAVHRPAGNVPGQRAGP